MQQRDGSAINYSCITRADTPGPWQLLVELTSCISTGIHSAEVAPTKSRHNVQSEPDSIDRNQCTHTHPLHVDPHLDVALVLPAACHQRQVPLRPLGVADQAAHDTPHPTKNQDNLRPVAADSHSQVGMPCTCKPRSQACGTCATGPKLQACTEPTHHNIGAWQTNGNVWCCHQHLQRLIPLPTFQSPSCRCPPCGVPHLLCIPSADHPAHTCTQQLHGDSNTLHPP